MREKARIIGGCVAVLLFAAVCAGIGYHISYPIKLNMATLPQYIEEFYDRGRGAEALPEITLYDGVGIGNKEYYLIEVGEELGSVTLKKGPFGRCKILYLRYGDGNFLDSIVESGGKKYLLFGGRDVACRISRISVSTDGRTYELDLGKATGHFLLYTEIAGYAEDSHVDKGKVLLYDEAGEDITELYDLSGGGI